jgi:hypothetical protein
MSTIGSNKNVNFWVGENSFCANEGVLATSNTFVQLRNTPGDIVFPGDYTREGIIAALMMMQGIYPVVGDDVLMEAIDVLSKVFSSSPSAFFVLRSGELSLGIYTAYMEAYFAQCTQEMQNTAVILTVRIWEHLHNIKNAGGRLTEFWYAIKAASALATMRMKKTETEGAMALVMMTQTKT